jgi:hypothetical protein
MPELPSYVRGAIQKALSKDKEHRYPTMGAFLLALEGRSVFASKQTKPELRSDLIDQCRPEGSLPVATLPTREPQTREYPALSFPAALLASVDQDPAPAMEPVLELAPVYALEPEYALEPLLTAGRTAPRQRGGGRRFWLLGCLLVALVPAPVVAALHYLHPAPNAALAYTSPPPTVWSPPRVYVAAPPLALPVVAAPVRPVTPLAPSSHKARVARPIFVRALTANNTDSAHATSPACRIKLSKQQTQANLAEGLGL